MYRGRILLRDEQLSTGLLLEHQSEDQYHCGGGKLQLRKICIDMDQQIVSQSQLVGLVGLQQLSSSG